MADWDWSTFFRWKFPLNLLPSMAARVGSRDVPYGERSVGVVVLNENKVQDGYTLICAGKDQFLIDNLGRGVHMWRSKRCVFSAYLLDNGNLLRDGSDTKVCSFCTKLV